MESPYLYTMSIHVFLKIYIFIPCQELTNLTCIRQSYLIYSEWVGETLEFIKCYIETHAS